MHMGQRPLPESVSASALTPWRTSVPHLINLDFPIGEPAIKFLFNRAIGMTVHSDVIPPSKTFAPYWMPKKPIRFMRVDRMMRQPSISIQASSKTRKVGM
jgi:hypothetical protein